MLREEISKWRLSHHNVWENVTGIFDVFCSTPHSRDVTDIIENAELAHRRYFIRISCGIDVDTSIEYFCSICIVLETMFWEIQHQNFENFDFFMKKEQSVAWLAAAQLRLRLEQLLAASCYCWWIKRRKRTNGEIDTYPYISTIIINIFRRTKEQQRREHKSSQRS